VDVGVVYQLLDDLGFEELLPGAYVEIVQKMDLAHKGQIVDLAFFKLNVPIGSQLYHHPLKSKDPAYYPKDYFGVKSPGDLIQDTDSLNLWLFDGVIHDIITTYKHRHWVCLKRPQHKTYASIIEQLKS
jgi:hypothetical protein